MRMAQIGLPIPPAFVLPTSWSRRNQPADGPLVQQSLRNGIARRKTAIFARLLWRCWIATAYKQVVNLHTPAAACRGCRSRVSLLGYSQGG